MVRAALWFSVVVPSLFIAERLVGWTGAAVYAGVVAALLPIVLSAPARLPPFTFRLVIAAIGVAVLAVVVIGHRTVDVDVPGQGSDDDDALEVGVGALLGGENPYRQHTYLGNPISPMPGALLLAAPFAIAGGVALQNPFWLAALFVVIARGSGGARVALSLCCAALLSLAVLHDLATGTSHMANGIYVVVALGWLIHSRGSVASSMFFGVTLASRANFFFLLPTGVCWLWRQESRRTAVRSAVLGVGTCALLVAPFYVADPSGFAPLFTLSKIQRYDACVPGASVVTGAVTGIAALMVGTRAVSSASLFAGCAIVQALPVGAVHGLSVVSGRPYRAALPYGEFAMWFVVMAGALAAATTLTTSSTLSTR